jgi:3-phosphoshikimate 1-carboxyvinyltransferase
MALPELIEIVPLHQTVRAEITVPGSKSITNRALILAALAGGEVTLNGALWSEDTQIMVGCLQALGLAVEVAVDPEEPCNRTIKVAGLGGQVPAGGTAEQPRELFVGNAGTAARFLAPFLCLGSGVYRLQGVPRMHERPQAALFQALRELGYRIEAEQGNDKLPARIYGGGAEGGGSAHQGQRCRVSIKESSQFASALLLSSKVGGWQIEIVDENADESPYVVMTTKLMEVFPGAGGAFQIEPDASSGSYFWAAGQIADASPENLEFARQFGVAVTTQEFHRVQVAKWPTSGWQIDEHFREYTTFGPQLKDALALMAGSQRGQPFDWKHAEGILAKRENRAVSRATDLGDSIMTAIATAACTGTIASASEAGLKFTDLGRLRVQECERVAALRTELTKCGVKVIEEGDTLTVFPAPPTGLHGAEIETYHDHRMAMCFAILGLKVPGIRIKNPACVKKTFPNFFQKLAAAPPQGLGAEIWEIQAGQRTRKLGGADLFAD